MRKSLLADDVLQRGFDLAYFIHGDKATAIDVVTDAAERVDVATVAQDKRLYYQPKGRLIPPHGVAERLRTKVSLSKLHLFQRLIYIASERYEKESESQNRCRLDQRAMIVRFIKHVVRITLKRNSFYVALGVSRLLHNYTTAETMAIYDFLQDPEQGRDDCYFRSRKSILMRELIDRFGDSLRICRRAHGEERFESVDFPARYAPLVRQSLEMFTLWETPCPVAMPGSSQTRSMAPFVSSASDLEDEVEISRMHAILHPPCLEWLTRSLGLTLPELRVDVPAFAMADDQRDEDRPPGERPRLHSFDLSEIRAHLAGRASFRKGMSTEVVRILVDGVDRGRLELREAANARFEIDPTAETIEIRSGYGSSEAYLALFLLPHEGEGVASCDAARTLESGDRLLLTVRATESGAMVEVRCHPVAVRRFIRWLTERPRMLASVPATAALLVLFGWLATYQRPRHGADTKATPLRSAPAVSTPALTPRPVAETDRSSTMERQASETLAEFDKTRGARIDDEEKSLLKRPRIYIEVQGTSSAQGALREAMAAALKSLPRARIVAADEASTALKLFIENQTENGDLTVQARLVDVNGRVLWPEDGTKRTYRGRTTAIGEAVANDLRSRFSAARR
jgi:hypothetical protein